MKGFIGFICGVVAGVALVLAYLHKAAIIAVIRGDKLPEAPDECPFSDCDVNDEPTIEVEVAPEATVEAAADAAV